MKKHFSTHWKSSSQPRKQRKYLANAPLHLRKKFISVNLAKELRKKEGKRKIPVIKGDKVKIFSGKFKGKTGKVLTVNLKTSKIIIENIQVKKMDGSKANIKLQPSNLQIIEMADRRKKKIDTTKNEKTNDEIKKTEKKEQRNSGEFKKNSEEMKIKENKKEKVKEATN